MIFVALIKDFIITKSLLFCKLKKQWNWQEFAPERKGNNSIFAFWLERAWLFWWVMAAEMFLTVRPKAGSIGKICEDFMNRILQFRWCLTPECIKRHSSTKHFFVGDERNYGHCGFNSRRNILKGRQVCHFLVEVGSEYCNIYCSSATRCWSSGVVLRRLFHMLTQIHIFETRCCFCQMEYTFAWADFFICRLECTFVRLTGQTLPQ
jgi:hypothetical protein